VRQEVKRRIDDLMDGGGQALASVHTMQPQVPAENIVTMHAAALKQGGGN
jgi:uroporphyrinogen decarboxylase